jgi:outer membrane protein, multidrug efflux system
MRRYSFPVPIPLIAVLFMMLLSACAVGPNYERPRATAIPEAYRGAAGEWKIAMPQAHLPRGDWWELFGDPTLNDLETRANRANQNLKAAVARFTQARAATDTASAAFLPRLSGSFQTLVQHDSQNRPVGGKPGKTYDSFTMPFDLSYELDLWGRVRKTVEAAAANQEATADDAESVRLAIQAEVAADYFALRSLDAERTHLLSGIDVNRRSLSLIRNRRAGGMITDFEVSQAETVLDTAEAQLMENALLRVKLQNALAVLIGENASGFQLPESPLDLLPVRIPPGLPSELLERRPDIAAAERRMAAANAGIGLAETAYYPSITFNGLAGFQSGDMGSLFEWPSRLWALGPALTWPLFDGGRRSAIERQATAAYEETVARYRQTVLSAFAEVENSLATETLIAGEYEKTADALQSARRQLELANNRYRGGLTTYLDVAVAQKAVLTIESTAAQLRGRQFVAAVALIKSLGGGWEVSDFREELEQ